MTISSEIGRKSWKEIYASLGDIPAKITQVYISISSYWLSWYPCVQQPFPSEALPAENRLRAAMLCIKLWQIPRVLLKLWQTWVVPHPLVR